MSNNLIRDFVGYGSNPPKGTWPGNARLAVQIVVNFEEGAEMSIEKGDKMPEAYGEFPPINVSTRDLGLESVFEYGSRVGIWRLLDIFDKEGIKTTFFACGEALENNPHVAREIVKRGHEICSHGYRWYDHFRLTEEESRDDVRKAVETIQKITGQRPVGWYCREPGMFTRKVLVEEGGFIYDSDAYNDDVPFYVRVGNKNHLVVPYTPDCNDFHFWMSKFQNADGFLSYLKDTFDVLYRESEKGLKMMSIGLHCRISGRPGRAIAILKFIEYAKKFPYVWFATRREIAEYWLEHHPISE